MKKIFIFTTLCMLMSFAKSQSNWGYFGKTHYVTYEFSYVIPYLYFSELGISSFHKFHRISFNQIINENNVVSIQSELGLLGATDIWLNDIEYSKINDKSIGLKYSYFSKAKGAVAPMGNSTGIGISMVLRRPIKNENMETASVKPLVFFFFMRQFIINDYLIASFGLESGYFLGRMDEPLSLRYVLKPNLGIGFMF